MTSTFDYYGYVVNIIIIAIFLGVMYFGSKLLTRNNVIKVSGRKMEILERISLGADRYLLMFKVSDNIYIMMVHRNGSELIDTIPADSIIDAENKVTQEAGQFSEILGKFSDFKKTK